MASSSAVSSTASKSSRQARVRRRSSKASFLANSLLDSSSEQEHIALALSLRLHLEHAASATDTESSWRGRIVNKIDSPFLRAVMSSGLGGSYDEEDLALKDQLALSLKFKRDFDVRFATIRRVVRTSNSHVHDSRCLPSSATSSPIPSPLATSQASVSPVSVPRTPSFSSKTTSTGHQTSKLSLSSPPTRPSHLARRSTGGSRLMRRSCMLWGCLRSGRGFGREGVDLPESAGRASSGRGRSFCGATSEPLGVFLVCDDLT